MIFQLAQTLATLYLPTLNANIIDKGIARDNQYYIWTTGGLMLAITLVQILCAIVAVYYGAQAAMALGRDVRHGAFSRVQRFSDRDGNHFCPPWLITRA